MEMLATNLGLKGLAGMQKLKLEAAAGAAKDKASAVAPRFLISKGASSFLFGRARPEFFFTERASPRAFFFFGGGGELKLFSGKTIPKSTKFFRPAAPLGAAGLVLTLNGAAGWLWGV